MGLAPVWLLLLAVAWQLAFGLFLAALVVFGERARWLGDPTRQVRWYGAYLLVFGHVTLFGLTLVSLAIAVARTGPVLGC